MTEIIFRKRGMRYTAEARGHATRADGRNDDVTNGIQVCAAITTVMDTLAVGVHILAERHKAFDVDAGAGTGFEWVRATGDEPLNILFCAAYLSLSLLAEHNPERLRVDADKNFLKFFRFS